MCAVKLIVTVFLLYVLDLSEALSLTDYLKLRADTIDSEKQSYFGADLVLKGDEIAANRCLMTAKFNEINKGLKNASVFWPTRNFLEVREEIKRSEVFKIIKLMPKGASLHTHTSAAVSVDFLYNNLTFMPNLYVCLNDRKIDFHFFETPSDDCNWKLLQDLRAKDPEINKKIRKKLALPTERSTSEYNSVVLWEKFLKMFDVYKNLLSYRPAFEKYVYQVLQEVYDDKILHLEIRYAPFNLHELDGTIYNQVEALQFFKRSIDKFIQDHPDFISCKLIFSSLKKVNDEKFDQDIKKFQEMKMAYPDLIIGFDIVGEEDIGRPLLNFTENLLKLGNETTFYFHAGETNWLGNDVDENLFDAILLNSKRIGHGFALIKHPKLMKMIKEKDIAIEINPISNQVLGYVNDLRNHPASYYFAENLPIVVTNDDPSFWGASGLSYDFYEAFIGIMSRRADLRTLKQLAINSIRYSAMSDEEQQRAWNIWTASWLSFVKYLANEHNCKNN